MDTKNFNLIDKIVAFVRLGQMLKYVKRDDRVLDFGCGTTSFLLNSVKSKITSGVGIDYDVNNKKESNVEYIKFKFDKRLPFKDKIFDKVFLLAVLEHIDVKVIDSLFLEFRRVLKNGGKIVLTTPTPESKNILEFLAYRLKIISSKEIQDHKKYYDLKEIKSIAKRSKLILSEYKLFFFNLNSKVVLQKDDK